VSDIEPWVGDTTAELAQVERELYVYLRQTQAAVWVVVAAGVVATGGSCLAFVAAAPQEFDLGDAVAAACAGLGLALVVGALAMAVRLARAASPADAAGLAEALRRSRDLWRALAAVSAVGLPLYCGGLLCGWSALVWP
jgi:hypothetical protein